MTGFHIEQILGGWKLFDPLNKPVAIVGYGLDERGALEIAQALNDAAEWPAKAARATAHIETHIAALPCDEVPDELVCALCVLNPAAGCVEVLT